MAACDDALPAADDFWAPANWVSRAPDDEALPEAAPALP
jgi:hypothetical protein